MNPSNIGEQSKKKFFFFEKQKSCYIASNIKKHNFSIESLFHKFKDFFDY